MSRQPMASWRAGSSTDVCVSCVCVCEGESGKKGGMEGGKRGRRQEGRKGRKKKGRKGRRKEGRKRALSLPQQSPPKHWLERVGCLQLYIVFDDQTLFTS